MKDTTRTLLRDCQPVSGLRNCHIHGVASLVFQLRQSPAVGMVRVFVVDDDSWGLSHLMTGLDFTVLPHTHRQDITISRLCGLPINARPVLGSSGHLAIRYRFESALLGGDFNLLPLNRCWIERFELTEIHDQLHLPACDIHTMTAAPGSAWVVEEGHVVGVPPECYSLFAGKGLDKTGLYVHMTEPEIAECWERVKKRSSL